jgi:hypothetical protein
VGPFSQFCRTDRESESVVVSGTNLLNHILEPESILRLNSVVFNLVSPVWFIENILVKTQVISVLSIINNIAPLVKLFNQLVVEKFYKPFFIVLRKYFEGEIPSQSAACTAPQKVFLSPLSRVLDRYLYRLKQDLESYHMDIGVPAKACLVCDHIPRGVNSKILLTFLMHRSNWVIYILESFINFGKDCFTVNHLTQFESETHFVPKILELINELIKLTVDLYTVSSPTGSTKNKDVSPLTSLFLCFPVELIVYIYTDLKSPFIYVIKNLIRYYQHESASDMPSSWKTSVVVFKLSY